MENTVRQDAEARKKELEKEEHKMIKSVQEAYYEQKLACNLLKTTERILSRQALIPKSK